VKQNFIFLDAGFNFSFLIQVTFFIQKQRE